MFFIYSKNILIIYQLNYSVQFSKVSSLAVGCSQIKLISPGCFWENACELILWVNVIVYIIIWYMVW